MNRSAHQILEDARKLPSGDFEWLVQNLVDVGDSTPEAELNADWGGEIEQRISDIDSGAIKMLPLVDVLERMDARMLARRQR